jgi:hypothetical protein
MTVIVKTNILKEKIERLCYETISWCLAIVMAGIAIGGMCMISKAYAYLINVVTMI